VVFVDDVVDNDGINADIVIVDYLFFFNVNGFVFYGYSLD